MLCAGFWELKGIIQSKLKFHQFAIRPDVDGVSGDIFLCAFSSFTEVTNSTRWEIIVVEDSKKEKAEEHRLCGVIQVSSHVNRTRSTYLAPWVGDNSGYFG